MSIRPRAHRAYRAFSVEACSVYLQKRGRESLAAPFSCRGSITPFHFVCANAAPPPLPVGGGAGNLSTKTGAAAAAGEPRKPQRSAERVSAPAAARHLNFRLLRAISCAVLRALLLVLPLPLYPTLEVVGFSDRRRKPPRVIGRSAF